MNKSASQGTDVQHCPECLYTSEHPLLLSFTDEGICTGCHVHREKDRIDWSERFHELSMLVNNYRNVAEDNYDCIVPVGGKDSYFVVYVVKELLKLNPLLVSFNRHYNTPIGIRNLERLRDTFACDIITSTSDNRVYRKLIQASVEVLGSIHWPYLAGSSVFPVQIAARHKVPLIIWGAHQALDQVGMFSHHDRIEMTRRYRKEHDLMGFEAEDLVDRHPHFTEEILQPFFYPDDVTLFRHGIRGIYLNNYLRWDSKAQHDLMIEKFQYLSLASSRTFDTCNEIHCAHYMGLHDHIRFAKHGYTKATDHITREIRLSRLSREEGLLLNEFFQKEEIDDPTGFLSWIELSRPSFDACIDAHRNPNVWERKEAEWKLRNPLPKSKPSNEQARKILERLSFRESVEDHSLWHLEKSQPYPLVTQGGAADRHG